MPRSITAPSGELIERLAAHGLQLAGRNRIIMRHTPSPGKRARVKNAPLPMPDLNREVDANEFLMVEARAISRTIFENWIFMDFTRPGVLEGAIPLLKPNGAQAVPALTDHYGVTHASVGTVRDAWIGTGDAGLAAEGLDVLMRVDGLVDPLLERQLRSGAVIAISSHVAFEFEASHPQLKGEFWDLQGHEVDGEIVRCIVTSITRYLENSFVYNGADPMSKIISVRRATEADVADLKERSTFGVRGAEGSFDVRGATFDGKTKTQETENGAGGTPAPQEKKPEGETKTEETPEAVVAEGEVDNSGDAADGAASPEEEETMSVLPEILDILATASGVKTLEEGQAVEAVKSLAAEAAIGRDALKARRSEVEKAAKLSFAAKKQELPQSLKDRIANAAMAELDDIAAMLDVSASAPAGGRSSVPDAGEAEGAAAVALPDVSTLHPKEK